MSLISIYFYAFLIVALAVYYIIPKKYQWGVLLAASLFFFWCVGTAWTIVYPVCSVVISWGCALEIRKAQKQGGAGAKRWLVLGVISNFVLLAWLKYLNFFLSSAGLVWNVISGKSVSWSVDILASLGISFYTLQIVAYLVDCYWGITEPQPNLGKLALFTMFFPQMISGPISRYGQLGNQLYAEHAFSWRNIRNGVIRIIVGTFKKAVLAEQIGVLIPYFLNVEAGRTGPVAFLGMVGYVIQIYADFAGCMDIVIGAAQCFDITMVENFNHPFLSRTIQEFWQKWHITLGLWLRDYVMYPILRSKTWNKLTKFCKNKWGKKAAKKIPTYLAMLILWLCMGLWHGGWWNYILEGVWFWAVIVIGDWCTPIFKRMTIRINTEGSGWIWFQRLRTMLIYAVGAIMFRCDSVRESLLMLRNIFSPLWIFNLALPKAQLVAFINEYGWSKIFGVGLVVGLSFLAFWYENYRERIGKGLSKILDGKPVLFQIMCMLLIVYAVLLFGNYGLTYNAADFIYGGF